MINTARTASIALRMLTGLVAVRRSTAVRAVTAATLIAAAMAEPEILNSGRAGYTELVRSYYRQPRVR